MVLDDTLRALGRDPEDHVFGIARIDQVLSDFHTTAAQVVDDDPPIERVAPDA